jgi:homoserine O-succinyltransferase
MATPSDKPVLPGSFSQAGRPTRVLRLGIVNNMPDVALARTEIQLLDMIEGALPGTEIALTFYSVPGILRGEFGNAHLARRGYRSLEALMSDDVDALIVTGTEPKQPQLPDEPFWPALIALFDWIDRAGPSTLFSCLAAHAAVLHYDGVARQRLAEKRFGMFDHSVVGEHALTQHLPKDVRVAHSRWNEVSKDALEARGYQILTEAPDAGVDLFVKQRRNLLVFHQGHPEYDRGTLFREYRRDIQRYLTGASDTYPTVPKNYFDAAELKFLSGFRERALLVRDEAVLADMPPLRVADKDKSFASPMSASLRAWLQPLTKLQRLPQLAAGASL